ncbi:MAG: hypothetical protein V1744_03440 [Candidatus Altiarchaeota archaeon]
MGGRINDANRGFIHKPQERLTPEQKAMVDDFGMMLTALDKALGLNNGHDALRMHAFMRGSGITTIPVGLEGMLPEDIKFHKPRYAFKLGTWMELPEVDFAFKRVLHIINLWPEKQKENQYSVTSVQAVEGENDSWKVTANKSSGEDPRTWTMKREGEILKVSGMGAYKELMVEDDPDGCVIYGKGDPLKDLELHSYAKIMGIKTEITEREKALWIRTLDEYRSAKDGYNVAKMSYHLKNLELPIDPKKDEKLIHDQLVRCIRGKDYEKVAGLLLFMQGLGITVTGEKKKEGEELIRKGLKFNREGNSKNEAPRDGESAAWLHYTLVEVYGGVSLGEQMKQIPPEFMQQAVGDPLPQTLSLSGEKATVETESWGIEYDMQTPTGVVRVEEAIPLRRGYHDMLKRFHSQQPYTEFEPVQPLYKVRGGNSIHLLDPEDYLKEDAAMVLPLERKELKDAKLLADGKHPIVLIAPDGTRYKRGEF